MGFPGGCKESACNEGDPGSIPGSVKSSGEGKGNPLQYSCLENPMDLGDWWAIVHAVAKWLDMTEWHMYTACSYSPLFAVIVIYVYIFMHFTVYTVFYICTQCIIVFSMVFIFVIWIFSLNNSILFFLLIKVVCSSLKRIQNSERHKEDNKEWALISPCRENRFNALFFVFKTIKYLGLFPFSLAFLKHIHILFFLFFSTYFSFKKTGITMCIQ